MTKNFMLAVVTIWALGASLLAGVEYELQPSAAPAPTTARPADDPCQSYSALQAWSLAHPTLGISCSALPSGG